MERQPEELLVKPLRFVGEQHGRPEQELKDHLTNLFSQDRTVLRAYLARIKYGDLRAEGVALCIRADGGSEGEIVKQIGEIFASIFGQQVYMDILFLTDAREAELAKICKPFFNVAANPA
jgi:hypothetical protein